MLVRIAGQRAAVGLKDGRLESGRAFISTFTYLVQDGPSGRFNKSARRWGMVFPRRTLPTSRTKPGYSSSADSSFPRRRRPASEAVGTFESDAKGFLMPPNASAFSRSRVCLAEGPLAPLRAHGPW